MKRLVKSLFFSLITVFACATASGQPYKKLTVDDFKAQPTLDNGEEIAYTSCSIAYSYQAKQNDNYYKLTFTIRLSINNDKSWIDKSRIIGKKNAAQILDHEQGHYNIAYLEQQELLTTVAHTVFYDDYKPVANKIFTTIDAKYRQLNHDYDAETQNSTNQVKQRKWDAWFQKQLESTPAGTQTASHTMLKRNESDVPIKQPAGKWLLLALLPDLACKIS